MKIYLRTKLMYLKLQELNESIISNAYNYLPKNYLQTLQHKQKESIVARYLISQFAEKSFGLKNFLPKIDKNGIPIFKNDIFWSISHKKDLVFIGIAKQKIGLDLEIIKERDKSLLDLFLDKEYKLLGEKNWENFYILWTGKEAIIKKYLGKLDDMKKFILEKVENIDTNIGGIKFNKKLTISGNKVYIYVNGDKVLALSF